MVIAVVVLAMAVLSGLTLVLSHAQQEEAAQGAPAPAASPAPAPVEGAQANLPEPAPGSSKDVQTMTLKIAGREAPVDPVQVTEKHVLLPPTDVQRLGWYSASAVPGSTGGVGSSVITGHINDAAQGDGFAHSFTALRAGDVVAVTMNGGNVQQFRVTQDPEHVVKGSPLPEVVNDAHGPNRLVLITCGGQFVGGQLGYADNVITVAEPV